MNVPEIVPIIADRRLPTDRPFTRHRAAQAGVGRRVLDRLVAEGALRKLLRGVYLDASARETVAIRAEAVALVVHPEAVITDRTAAWLHGASINPAGDYLPPVSVFQLPDNSRIRAAATTSGTRTLEPDDIEIVNGIRVTTPLRTALDLGRLLKRDAALAALDGLLRLGRFHQADLRSETRRFRGYRGVVQLRCLIPLSDARSESPQESVLRLRWLDAMLPEPHPQYVVVDDNGFPIYRLDLADPTVRFAAEYDGQDHHFTAEQRERDDRRRAWLRRRGWLIDVFDRKALASRTVRSRLVDGHRRAMTRHHAAA
ncbi:type IV toxin-antitoxin system AbiEi family antitoxin domain-containing protein [Microlunatus speluncae]|uniref:type IV toxin-antitoxin system AbiEi family antitoxin domain-containing protein n=1 Tax=Microlunatus speluncae TaxID=2594267 RepID=UPI00126668C4|nr:type IV toxin-antitoxin system AbiEi family antitoxin domain-containing protein [Microlunatus speluncae]